MAAVQRFRIGQDGWCCASCGAPMTEAADGEGGVIMTHENGCSEVKTLTAGRA